jgi:hypothetical protein
MNLFCLLWIPLFYFFWAALTPAETTSPGGVWALLLGSAFTLTRFITGPWVSLGEFGLFRWLSALVDTVGLPALMPLLFFVLFVFLKVVPSSEDPTGFALLWLIPEGILRSISRNGRHDAVFLVLVPLLWTAVTVGMPFFVRVILDGNRWFLKVLALFGTLILPLAAATCYWAFFCQRLLWGRVSFGITLLPLILFTSAEFRRAWKHN